MNIDEINIGDLKIWNFDKKKDQYIKDKVLKEKIERILKTHKTHHCFVRNIANIFKNVIPL